MSKHNVYVFGILALTALLLGACAPAAPEIQEVEVTRQVEVPVTVVAPVEVEAKPFPDGTRLHLVQWAHFVPQYDKWFDPFLQDWCEKNNVECTVDHVAITDMAPTLATAIDAGEGPTMVELLLGASTYVQGLQDLTDIVEEAEAQFGPMVAPCKANSYLPANDMWYGFCHMWTPDPGDYDIEKWTAVGFPEGPDTWEDLLVGGKAIKEQFGVPMGLGLSPEIDSNMAMRSIIWSYGGSEQDENENVTIDSPEVVEAVNYLAQLYRDTMTEEVFGWNAASNNQGLIAGELSYILNSISAYRSLQKIDPAAADNIGFVDALKGPGGDQHASAHVWNIYVMPSYVTGDEREAAKAFLLHLVANYNQAVFNSELYNFPAFPSTAPQLYGDTGWASVDPFGSRPNDKLKVLLTAENWVTYLGWPGPSSPAVGEVYSTNIVVTMMSQVALGEKTAEVAVCEAHDQIEAIFEKWRALGLVGGTATPDCAVG